MTTQTFELLFSDLEFVESGWFSQIRSHILAGYGVEHKFVCNHSDDLQVNKMSSCCGCWLQVTWVSLCTRSVSFSRLSMAHSPTACL